MHIFINFNAQNLFAEIDKHIGAPTRATVFHLFVCYESQVWESGLKKLDDRSLFRFVVASVWFIGIYMNEARKTITVVFLITF